MTQAHDEEIKASYSKQALTLSESEIQTSILKAATLDPKEDIVVVTTLESEEFTSVCPWSGLPDFAKISIHYEPKNLIIEMKSLKYYINSFRNVGTTMEKACQRICSDLGNLIHPEELSVIMTFKDRGGWSNEVKSFWTSDHS